LETPLESLPLSNEKGSHGALNPVFAEKEQPSSPLRAAGLRRAEVAPATQAGLSNGVNIYLP